MAKSTKFQVYFAGVQIYSEKSVAMHRPKCGGGERTILTAVQPCSTIHGMSNTTNNDPQTNTEAQAQVAVGQMIHSLSLSIYERAVAQQMIGELDEESMQQLARASVTAARAYFVGVGAIRPASPIAQP